MSNKSDNVNEALLRKMHEDHLAGKEIYHASKFWEKLNQLNIEWLRSDGLNNFKRSVNNNYFNWMVQTKSIYFKNMARLFLRRTLRRPKMLFSLLTKNISEMHHRTYVSNHTKMTYFQRKIYAFYLFFLYDYVQTYDEFGLFDELSEPSAGNPIVIDVNGKSVSQDISNSYLEYTYVRKALGEEFSSVKTIAEIGAGYGRLIYLFHLLHGNEGKKLILIDLPPALLVSQWYLQKVFPDAKVMSYRNFSNFSEIESTFEASSICFLLPHQVELLPNNTIDLIINISSLQEMSRSQINHYYELIGKKTRYFYTKQWVLWENPEDKVTVPALIYPTRPDWGLVSARVNPVHTEFFEAMFKVQ